MSKFNRLNKPLRSRGAKVLSKPIQECSTEAMLKWRQTHRPRMKECYKNACEVLAAPFNTTYHEGWAIHAGIPYAHAWSVLDDGRVLDFTADACDRYALRQGWDVLPMYYVGMPIPHRFVLAETIKANSHMHRLFAYLINHGETLCPAKTTKNDETKNTSASKRKSTSSTATAPKPSTTQRRMRSTS